MPLLSRRPAHNPYSVNPRTHDIIVYNPLAEESECVIFFSIAGFYDLNRIRLKPGMSCMSFCRIHTLKPEVTVSFIFAGMRADHYLIPLAPGLNKQIFIVSALRTPPSLRTLATAESISSRAEVPNLSELGVYLRTIPYPASLIEHLCTLPADLVNFYLGRIPGRYFMELEACDRCDLIVSHPPGQLPSHCPYRSGQRQRKKDNYAK